VLETYVKDIVSKVANGNARDQAGSINQIERIGPPHGTRSSILDKILERRQRTRGAKSSLYARLNALGVTHEDFVSSVERSKQSGASVIQELIAHDVIDADSYFQRLAREMGVEYVEAIKPATILTDMNPKLLQQNQVPQLFGHGPGGMSLLYIAPDLRTEDALNELMERDASQRKRIRICTPKTILTAIEQKHSIANLEWATKNLYQEHQALSAKNVLVPWQAYLLGAFCVGLPVCLYHQLLLTLTAIQMLASLLFSLVVLTRIAALRSLRKRNVPSFLKSRKPLPNYSVLVALHKEAAVAAQLVRAMSQLDWPSSRLEVLYVCEADDHQTIEALTAHGFPSHHRIIKVPPGAPRTKPKALNFALKLCKGDFVVIYDAEDRPHPHQLQEAWSKFSSSDDRLACLQAPLVVTNARVSWLAKMFAFEYAAHFKGLLPHLAETHVPLPLGGTSNHFRKSALETVGAWDPHNVTEDADLGIRFYRFGYRCDVIQLPTLEDGPETLAEWYPQRTRWQKGWMQTFLVQNRNMSRLFQSLGKRNTLSFEVLLTGFILSPLLYSVSIVMAAYSMFTLDPAHMAVTITSLSLFLMGYICAIAMGFACVQTYSFKNKMIIALTLPAYWLLLSAAAWRAVYQLVLKPHHWEKTPHRPALSRHMSWD
jgi:cellulose synthase/poly-beta-1,6-N-acetylglucosamine synthase-like glycosyltransferase